jgi:hypothetical protein
MSQPQGAAEGHYTSQAFPCLTGAKDPQHQCVTRSPCLIRVGLQPVDHGVLLDGQLSGSRILA